MTFNEIVQKIAQRANQTSPEAITRIGSSVNEKYREVVSSCGLQTSVRGTAYASTAIGNRFVVFNGCEKVFSVYNPAFTPPMVLDQITVDQLLNQPLGADPPTQYAIYQMGASTVTIQLGGLPASIYALAADVEQNQPTLSGLAVPNFAEDYHDILTYHGLSVEYDKMQMPMMADRMDKKAAKRLAELQYFIAKSAYLQVYQNKSNSTSVVNQNLV